MKYRVTIRNITSVEELPPPDSVNDWTVHSFKCTGDQLIVLWAFDDVLAEQRKNRKIALADRFGALLNGMQQTERDLVELARHHDRMDVPKALNGTVAALRVVLQDAHQGFGC